jgi:hypothetical protein
MDFTGVAAMVMARATTVRRAATDTGIITAAKRLRQTCRVCISGRGFFMP